MGVVYAIAFALILYIPDRLTIVIHRLCRQRAINIFSANWRSFSWSGTLPIQRPLARALLGRTPFFTEDLQFEHIFLRSWSTTGPLMSTIGSSDDSLSVTAIPG